MTLLALDKWGGIAPKIVDPALLPPNRSLQAKNVRFDRGGISPLRTDLFVEDLTETESTPVYGPGEEWFQQTVDIGADGQVNVVVMKTDYSEITFITQDPSTEENTLIITVEFPILLEGANFNLVQKQLLE